VTVVESLSAGPASVPRLAEACAAPQSRSRSRPKLYYRRTCEGMVFIAEIFDSDAIKSISENSGAKGEDFGRNTVELHGANCDGGAGE